MQQIWKNAPDGISGNDDLGEMSSWYVWAALGMYPLYPGRADVVLGSPLFAQAIVERPGGRLTINAKGAATNAPYISSLRHNGQPTNRPWLDETAVLGGGTLDYVLSTKPSRDWGAAPADTPPSFGPHVP